MNENRKRKQSSLSSFFGASLKKAKDVPIPDNKGDNPSYQRALQGQLEEHTAPSTDPSGAANQLSQL